MALTVFSNFISMVFILCSLQIPLLAQETPSESSPPATEEAAKPHPPETQSWPTFERAFQAGVSTYQKQNYPEARAAFSQALQMQPNNVQTLVNLALVQFQLGQKAWAIALLRKAYHLDPKFSVTQSALQFILPQMDIKEIPHEIQLRETLRESVLNPVSLSTYLGFTALTLFATGWIFLAYFGKRRVALRNEEALPGFPVIGSLIALFFITSLSLTLLKSWDQSIPRGTVVSEKVTVYSAPSEKSVALFDLYGGLEVVLSTSQEDWVQVTYPGALTGWVPKASIYQTSPTL
jgi:tetratricopeptide (TPR) repeat protein